MLCQGLGQKWRGVCSGLFVPALHRAFIFYWNLSVQSLELEARPGSYFVACGSLWRVCFWKAAEGGWTVILCARKSSLWKNKSKKSQDSTPIFGGFQLKLYFPKTPASGVKYKPRFCQVWRQSFGEGPENLKRYIEHLQVGWCSSQKLLKRGIKGLINTIPLIY